MNLAWPTLSNTQDASLRSGPGLALGAGATLGFTVWDQWVLETGLVYVVRSFSQSSDLSGSTTFSTPAIQIPLLLRMRTFKDLSFGLGGYISHFAGDATVTQGGVTSVTQIVAISQVQNEAGLLGSARWQTPINELMSFVLDLRMLYGLTNGRVLSTVQLNGYDVQLWAGISYIL